MEGWIREVQIVERGYAAFVPKERAFDKDMVTLQSNHDYGLRALRCHLKNTMKKTMWRNCTERKNRRKGGGTKKERTTTENTRTTTSRSESFRNGCLLIDSMAESLQQFYAECKQQLRKRSHRMWAANVKSINAKLNLNVQKHVIPSGCMIIIIIIRHKKLTRCSGVAWGSGSGRNIWGMERKILSENLKSKY